MHCVKHISRLMAAAISCGLCLSAHASQGLVSPEAEAWWPQWQARLSLMGASTAAFSLTGPISERGGLIPRPGIQGAALLGDYYFARPATGSFRARGGLMLGSVGGAPLLFTAVPLDSSAQATAPRLGVTVLSGSSRMLSAGTAEGTEALPYMGLGYSGTLWRDSISLTADLGLVPERAGAASKVRRALFGNQGMSQALRNLQLSPVLQLGMRYSF